MDMETLMAQAQDLQTKISAAQDSLAQMHVKGLSENGAVVVTMTGKYDIVSVVISDNAITLGAKKLSDLVADAYKDAKAKADTLIEKVMSSVTGGLPE
ncbi:MAG: YbaB/EbfC family nucleoid-associated protein [Alphaproteobacteria bacterium]|nr:YbaB/EbfC family nucleoid-associated protein [Alphaproteobacteria bacterium]